jgi:hypothetical protein
MEIACIISTVQTTILLVQTSKAFIWKLLAADVRRGSKQERFYQNFQNFDRTVVRPDGTQFYQAKHSFEPLAYK